MNRTKTRVTRLAFAMLTVISLAASAAGSQVSYFGLDDPRGTLTNSKLKESQFLASLSSYGTDDLESSKTFVPNPSLTFTGTTLTATTNSSFVAALAIFAVSGKNFMSDRGPANDTLPGIPDVFTLSAPVTAFGLFASNGGDAKVANTVTLLLENTLLGTSKTVPVATLGPGATSTNVFFFGVTDTDPFDRVSLVESYDFDGLLLDNITAGFVVPEPNTLALAGIAVAVLLAGRGLHAARVGARSVTA